MFYRNENEQSIAIQVTDDSYKHGIQIHFDIGQN